MREVLSRSEARAAGLARFYTGKPCRYGHVAERYTCSGKCSECQRRLSANFKARNQCQQTAYRAERYAVGADREREKTREWKRNNRARHIEQKNRRRAAVRNAIPPTFDDFDQFVMEEAGEACIRRAAIHGEPFHVDHLVPLSRGGLHCATNVQAIPARLNLWKRDRMVLTRPGEWIAYA